ncbi:MAG: hypothetical protein M3023_01545 [Pseudomonadota bacterium]|nr:hypothetical protein [Pseudomonadota bacterium]
MRPSRSGIGAKRGAALLIAILAGCASAPGRLAAPRAMFGVQIAPYATVEECMSLAPGERVGYRFDARPPVAFSVHFHDGNAVIVPVARDRTTSESGDFSADRKQVYCLTWEAGAEGSVVDYRINPWPRPP